MDDDDKVRRNVMVVSAAVLLYAWLDLPPAYLTEKLFGDKAATSIAEWKMWAALLAVLVYQAHRFWAVGSQTADRNEAEKWYRFRLDELIRALAEEDVTSQRNGRSLGFVRSKPPARYAQELKGWSIADTAPAPERRRVVAVDKYFGSDPWYRSVRIADIDETAPTPQQNQVMHFDVHLSKQWWYSLRVAVGMLRTPHFSNLGMPIALCYSAICLVASRLSAAVS